jgi:hypothetical protein
MQQEVDDMQAQALDESFFATGADHTTIRAT